MIRPWTRYRATDMVYIMIQHISIWILIIGIPPAIWGPTLTQHIDHMVIDKPLPTYPIVQCQWGTCDTTTLRARGALKAILVPRARRTQIRISTTGAKGNFFRLEGAIHKGVPFCNSRCSGFPVCMWRTSP